jgi:predicted helicase
MRKYLEQDFDTIYILDLGGNVRKNPKLSGTTITCSDSSGSKHQYSGKAQTIHQCKTAVYYARVGEDWPKKQNTSSWQKNSISGTSSGRD